MNTKTLFFTALLALSLFFLPNGLQAEQNIPKTFVNLVTGDDKDKRESLEYIRKNWDPSFTIMMLEVIYLTRGPSFAGEYLELMEEKTGKKFGYNIDAWYEWIWNQESIDHNRYADFKSQLYSLIDPKFGAYFNSNYTSKIRLDEVRWGGVVQDGIPPLRSPKMISAPEAK